MKQRRFFLLVASLCFTFLAPISPSHGAYQSAGLVVDWVGTSLVNASTNWTDSVASQALVQSNTTYNSANGGFVTLNGSSAFLKASSNLPTFTTTTMSMFFWIKPTSNTGVIATLGRDISPDDADSEMLFSLNASGNLVIWDYNGSQGLNLTSTSSVTLNQWNYVGFTKTLSGSNSNIAFYINGNAAGTGSGGSRVISLNSFGIGKDVRDNNAFFVGSFQRATVWSTALTSTDVLNNYQASNGFAIAPSISLSNNNQTVNANSSISNAVVSNTGGAISSYSISPGLPNGLALDANGTISGTPVTRQSTSNFTLTATNLAGSATATFTLLVLVATNTVEFSNVSSAMFRKTSTITVALPAVGKVTFLNENKRIAGCIKVSTVNSNGISATCSWKPMSRGLVSLSVFFTQTSGGSAQFTSPPIKIWVDKRTGTR